MKKIIKAIIKPIIILLIIALIIGLAYKYLQKRNKNYDLEIVESYNYYPLLKDGKYGIIDLQGNILVNPDYKQTIIPNPSKDVFVCINENNTEGDEDDTTIVFNQNGEQIFKEYENVSAIRFSGTVSDMPYEKTVLSYKKDGKYGLIDYKGKKVTDAIYEEIMSVPYKEGEILAKKDGKYGVINNKGVVLIEFEYDEISGDGFYNEDTKYKDAGYFIGIKTDDGYRYGYINKKFEKILDTEYNDIYRIDVEDDEKNIYLKATKNGQVGIIYNGKEIIKCEYQDIDYDDKNKCFLVVKDSKRGVYDINGTNIVPVEYDYIAYKGDYIYAELNNDEVKYFDKFGKEVEEASYLDIFPTDNVIYNITESEDGQYGIIDGKGNVLVDNTYAFIDYAFDNYFIALRDGKLGVIDDKENNIIEFKYDVLQCVNGTNVIQGKISDTDTMDLYSKKMEKVATVENAVINQYDDYIEIYSEKSTKYFDFEGNEKTNIQILKNNELFAIEKDGKWGMTDKMGNIVVECIYDKVTELNEYGFAGIKLDGKWGVIDKTGKVILEPTYEHFANNEKPEFINKYYKVTYGYGESYYTDEE